MKMPPISQVQPKAEEPQGRFTAIQTFAATLSSPRQSVRSNYAMNPLRKVKSPRQRNQVIENMQSIMITGQKGSEKEANHGRNSEIEHEPPKSQISGDITSKTETGAPSPRITQHNYKHSMMTSTARGVYSDKCAAKEEKQVVKSDIQTQTLSESSDCKVSERGDQTGRLYTTSGNQSMLKMMSELNQDIKVANHDIGRSVAYMAAKVKLRDGIIKKPSSSRE